MADQPNAAQGSAPAVATIDDAALLRNMLSILMEEKAELARERQEKKRQLEVRTTSHKSLAKYNEKEQIDKESICTHLKGGKIKSPRTDYAVGHHTYPDNSSFIRCLICGAKWKKLDTKEFLVRRGKKVPNHTGLGWLDAIQMLKSSTNTPTSSITVTKVTTLSEETAE